MELPRHFFAEAKQRKYIEDWSMVLLFWLWNFCLNVAIACTIFFNVAIMRTTFLRGAQFCELSCIMCKCYIQKNFILRAVWWNLELSQVCSVFCTSCSVKITIQWNCHYIYAHRLRTYFFQRMFDYFKNSHVFFICT